MRTKPSLAKLIQGKMKVAPNWKILTKHDKEFTKQDILRRTRHSCLSASFITQLRLQIVHILHQLPQNCSPAYMGLVAFSSEPVHWSCCVSDGQSMFSTRLNTGHLWLHQTRTQREYQCINKCKDPTWSQSHGEGLLVARRQYLHPERQDRAGAPHSSTYCGHTCTHLGPHREGIRDVVHVLDDQTVLKEDCFQAAVSGKALKMEKESQSALTYDPCVTVDRCLLARFFNDLGHFHTTQGGAWQRHEAGLFTV